MGETSVEDYIVRSKLTGAGRKGASNSLEHWDYLAADKPLSIFWTFLSWDCYYDRTCMADPVKIGILVVNVYHFFVRKWCLPQCLNNLFKTFNPPAGIKDNG